MPGETGLRAKWRWGALLRAIGVPDDYLTGKHGPCPFCGGNDRFRWDNKEGRGTWICSSCGAGDGMMFVVQFLGVEFSEAGRRIDALLNEWDPQKDKEEEGKKNPRIRLRAIAKDLLPHADSKHMAHYLNFRGLRATSPELREHPAMAYWESEAGKRPVKKGAYPAMVAMVRNGRGEPVTFHVTYLGPNGKADVPSPRKMLPGLESVLGCAVRLLPVKGRVLGVAEGIETSLAAHELFDVPVWAALNAGAMESFVIPTGIDTLIVFGDNDKNFRGQKAAYTLGNRAATRGIETRVIICPQEGGDFLDQLIIQKRP